LNRLECMERLLSDGFMKPDSWKFKILKSYLTLTLGLAFTFPALASGKDAARNADWYYKAGLALYQKASYEDALERFEQALDENFEHWQSYQMIGNCYYQLRDKEKSLEAFAQSLRINPLNLQLAGYYQRLKTGKVCLQIIPVECKLVPLEKPVVVTSLLLSLR
jgi:tetratricopeptide (TPR) repeat protein